MTLMPAIKVTSLRKSFGGKTVLDGIDLTVPAGTIFSLLGQNGTGKTTTIKILSTLMRADGGEAMLAGHDLVTEPQRVREAIGVSGQFSAVDGLLTGEENIMLMADLNHLPRLLAKAKAAELLARFDLTDAKDELASTYSGGMRRRLDLAMSLTGEPSIIFLDEPTTGLDPRSRQTLWQIVRELTETGITIFLTTQYLEEADHLAHNIAVLDHGMIVAEGTPDELKRRIPGGHVTLTFTEQTQLDAAARLYPAAYADASDLTLRVPSDSAGSPAEVRALLDRLDADGVKAEHLDIHTPDLDDVFFALTGASR